MDNPTYETVVQAWCEATGMTPWDIDTPQHVDIEGHTVGLLYDPREPHQLDVLFELEAASRPDVLRKLLQANMHTDLPHGGCYALHPETEAVVYRLRLPLAPDTDGARLPSVLFDALAQARQVLDT